LLFVLFVLLCTIGPDDLRALEKEARHPTYEGFDRRQTLKAMLAWLRLPAVLLASLVEDKVEWWE
tara:strand:+ start:1801 stop:1995 length:195 start_codon:yes stop_codon:yes gene_type:complete